MTPSVRLGKKNLKATEKKKDEASKVSAYQSHAQEDAALKKGEEELEKLEPFRAKALTRLGRIAVFLGFPLLASVIALYIGYLRSQRHQDQPIDLDKDFIFPFLLSLCLTLVVGFQTKGFTTTQIQPVIRWPKVKRTKKIIYQTVVVDDDEYKENEPKGASDKKDD